MSYATSRQVVQCNIVQIVNNSRYTPLILQIRLDSDVNTIQIFNKAGIIKYRITTSRIDQGEYFLATKLKGCVFLEFKIKL